MVYPRTGSGAPAGYQLFGAQSMSHRSWKKPSRFFFAVLTGRTRRSRDDGRRRGRSAWAGVLVRHVSRFAISTFDVILRDETGFSHASVSRLERITREISTGGKAVIITGAGVNDRPPLVQSMCGSSLAPNGWLGGSRSTRADASSTNRVHRRADVA